jgi:regulator of sigma D
MIDTVKENVSVQITTSQARRMRLLRETVSNRFKLEDEMIPVHTPAELEAVHKKKKESNFET